MNLKFISGAKNNSLASSILVVIYASRIFIRVFLVTRRSSNNEYYSSVLSPLPVRMNGLLTLWTV